MNINAQKKCITVLNQTESKYVYIRWFLSKSLVHSMIMYRTKYFFKFFGFVILCINLFFYNCILITIILQNNV